MRHVLLSQSYTHETHRVVATVISSRVEVGRGQYGLHHRFANYAKRDDSIWVIVDRLTKSAHFILVKNSYRPPEYADLYMAEMVKLHGISKTIISDSGPQFTAHFWKRMHKSLWTSLVRNTTYNPQTSGQTERLNQVLEDMLRDCVLSSRGSWESWLPLAEFSYNNSYQESIKMAPFEALYGRKCRTLLNWAECGERRYYGIDFVNDAEKKEQMIQQHMRATQSRQKSYADKRRRPLEFNVGDYVYLKVTPMKKVQRFRVRSKLAPRYVRPYQIKERKGPVAYKVQLPEELSSIFPVFHVSQLRKCLKVPEQRIEPRGIKIKADLEYKEQPVGIVDTKERVTRNRVVKTYKVVWSHHDDRDATWETEDYQKQFIQNFIRNG